MLSEQQKKENEERFYNILKSVSRPKKDELLSYLKNRTDFFMAPAGITGTLACPGGLLQHCLNVYDCTMKKVQSAFWQGEIKPRTDDVIIASLFANLCYINYFKEIRDENSILTGYEINDRMPFGIGGEKSVWILAGFMTLYNDEIYSIRWFKGNPNDAAFRVAVKMYPLVLAVYEAELEARMIEEK